MGKYALGIDFGTLSARALLVDVENGREAGTAVMDYPHGVLDEALPDGTRLPPDWALQHPNDYLECLGHCAAGAGAGGRVPVRCDRRGRGLYHLHAHSRDGGRNAAVLQGRL